MEDQELEAIRSRRMQELQQAQGGNPAAGGAGRPNEEQKQRQEEMQQKQEEFRNMMLSRILSQQARARLNVIKTAKPEKARMVEDILINNARMGAFGPGQLSEEDFKNILERVNEQMPTKQTKVNYDRRRVNLDSDSD